LTPPRCRPFTTGRYSLGAGGARLPWTRGILPQVHPQLWLHRRVAHHATQGGLCRPEVASAFIALKESVTSAPVLAMPDFDKPFVVECNASSHGFGAVLIQEGHPIAFFSRPVAPRHQALAAYERDLIGLVQAVRHWRPYLWGRRFTVKTDHDSLKYLLDQCLATIPQHHWVGKLLGFDFSVEYKSRATNAVADALSRRDTGEGEILALSAPRFDFIDKLRQAQLDHPDLVALCGEITAGTRPAPWALVDGMVQFSGWLYIPVDSCCYKRSWGPYMRIETKAYNGHSTGCALTSIFLTGSKLCRNGCVRVKSANATSPSTSTRQVSFFRCRFPRACGLMPR
jgi:hypothetical protein